MIEIIEIFGSESFYITASSEYQELTNENVLKYLKKHEKHHEFYSNCFIKEIEYVSSHFYELCEIAEEEIKTLQRSTIDRIVRSTNLRLRDEDQLLNFLNILYEIERDFSSLYDCIIFTNVSPSSMRKFVDTIELNDMNQSTWISIKSRLCSEIKKSDDENGKINEKRYKKMIKSFPYKEGYEMNGIIHYLTNKTGQNIHENGTIEITSNYTDSSNPPKNIIDFNNGSYYRSSSGNSDVWICFNFKNIEIEISSYTIKSARESSHVKNWVIEVSNDGSKWTEIHQVTNYSELNGNNNIKTFQVQQKQTCKYCRFRHTGYYWNTGNNLRIGCIEFYGSLKMP